MCAWREEWLGGSGSWTLLGGVCGELLDDTRYAPLEHRFLEKILLDLTKKW
jgi:hypothetical protein